jgi:hypothetical protein
MAAGRETDIVFSGREVGGQKHTDHSLGAGIFNDATTTSGDQLSDLALTTRAAIRGDRSAAVTRLIFF